MSIVIYAILSVGPYSPKESGVLPTGTGSLLDQCTRTQMCVAVPSGILSSTTRRGQVSLTLMLPASSEGDVSPLKQTNSEWGVPPHKQTNVSRMSTNKPDHGLLSSKKKYLRKNLNRDQMMNTQEEHTTRSAHVLFITSSRYNSRVICSHNYV